MKRTPLIPRPPTDHSREPGYREWHEPIFGRCSLCGRRGTLERHHVIAEQVVRREHGNPYDLRNSLPLGRYCRCHRQHTSATRRLPRTILPAAALEFAIELLGESAARAYLERFYSP